jgi:hypothetical protein
MNALRIFVVILACGVMLSGGSATAHTGDPVSDTCMTDGNTDTGNNVLSTDKDSQDGDTANNNCGPNENADSQSDVASPDTNSNSDDTSNDTNNAE